MGGFYWPRLCLPYQRGGEMRKSCIWLHQLCYDTSTCEADVVLTSTYRVWGATGTSLVKPFLSVLKKLRERSKVLLRLTLNGKPTDVFYTNLFDRYDMPEALASGGIRGPLDKVKRVEPSEAI